jgi:methylenetetrahydrofolate dehydrogenase (NADP+)/methenyltetrahydrofolate cyclohydrolase
MILIDGKKAAAELREELKQEVAELKTKYNKVPGLTVILIGDMAPSQIYVRNKEKSANEVGLKSEVIKYPDTVEEKTVLEKIEELIMMRVFQEFWFNFHFQNTLINKK